MKSASKTMDIFGAPEVQYWQLTPIGVQRLQSGSLGSINPTEQKIMTVLAEMGGIAEVDELTTVGNISPGIVVTALRHLADLGYITPVAPQQEQLPT